MAHPQPIDLAGPHGTVQTPSGLLVPRSAVEVPDERWLEDDVRKLRRAFKVLAKAGINVVFMCADPRCQADPVIRLSRELDARDRDVTVLTCQHTTRRLPGVL